MSITELAEQLGTTRQTLYGALKKTDVKRINIALLRKLISLQTD
jgi:predicted DNA-binding protein YlxM (UPF0122 family)